MACLRPRSSADLATMFTGGFKAPLFFSQRYNTDSTLMRYHKHQSKNIFNRLAYLFSYAYDSERVPVYNAFLHEIALGVVPKTHVFQATHS